MALVFPPVTLMQKISGCGISSAVASVLCAGKRDQPDALGLHAVVINLALGLLFSAMVLGFGQTLYQALG